MSVADAAAWCGVGTRFLVDLEMAKDSLQLDKALQVARRMGVDLLVSQRAACPSQQASQSVVVQEPVGCPAAAAWLALAHAGMHVAHHCGVAALDCEPVRTGRMLMGLRMDTGPWQGSTPMAQLLMPDPSWNEASASAPWTPMPTRWHEEEGGPGLPAAMELVLQGSGLPVADVQRLVRWILLCAVLQDTHHHLGRLRVRRTQHGIELLPVAEVLCCSAMLEQPPRRGLRIGNVWPELHLRADQWKKLADVAGVHPKVVFQTMRELGARVPGLLEQALQLSLGALPSAGPALEAVKRVRLGASRMSELALAAARQVSGLKTAQQPRIKPVATTLVVEPPLRRPLLSDPD